MIAGLRTPKSLVDRLRPPDPRSEACLNCGASLAGPFCAQCGQRDIPPYPSVRELVTDAFWELSGWDGRFAGTVRALLRRPGFLTTEFLEGRRARYISPLRLYLMASLVYFVVAASVPYLGAKGKVTAAGIQIDVGTTGPGHVSAAAADARTGQITADERATALKEIEKAPRALRPVLRRAIADPAGFKRGLLESMPRVLFVLVPAFAAILGVFFRRRKYPEHLYVSLHLHAFVFVALSMGALAKFTHLTALAAATSLAAALWIIVYTVLALRHVYGESTSAVIARSVGVAVLYGAVGAAALTVLVYWAALYA